MSDYYVRQEGEMPEYFDQLLGMVAAFHEADPTGVQQQLFVIMSNALADDGTDRKLDVLSVALFMVTGYHAMPGAKEGMPLDPGFIDDLDGAYRQAYEHLHRTGLVERQFNLLNGQQVDSDLEREEELMMGLLCRAYLTAMMIEQIRREESELDGAEQEFFQTLAGFMGGAVEMLHEWRRDGHVPAEWDLPQLP